MKFEPLLNFFSDLAGRNISTEATIVSRSAFSITRLYKDYPYLTIAIAIGLVGFLIYLFQKYGNTSEPLRKVPQWTPLDLVNYGSILYYDSKNFLKSKTFTWVDVGKEYKEPFDEFGSNFQVLQYRFNHKEKTYRLFSEVRYSDGLSRANQTYKQENSDVTWYPITDPLMLSIYERFLSAKKNS